MRKTIRQSLTYGGVPLELSYRVQRKDLPRLVLLLDVSHSMDYYSYLLARFARGVVFAFSDAEVTSPSAAAPAACASSNRRPKKRPRARLLQRRRRKGLERERRAGP